MRTRGAERREVVDLPPDGPAVWDATWSAGEEHGLTPLGLEALQKRLPATVVRNPFYDPDKTRPRS